MLKNRILLSMATIGLAMLTATTLSAQYQIGGQMARKQINGRNLLVHVTVAAPIGVPVETVADREIRRRGAAPIQSAPFVTIGPAWPNFSDATAGNDFIVQHYNGFADPTVGQGKGIWNRTRTTWSNVATSSFAFEMSENLTTRCPSLVDECPGPQTTDGFHDVGWCNLGDLSPIFGGILGVTWFEWDGSNALIEADVCLNANPTVAWTTGSPSNIDVETVLLHEQGHVAALGHSTNRRAVMYRSYLAVRQALHSDDVNGITFLYPEDDGGEDPPGSCVVPEGAAKGSPCANDGECCSGSCKGKPGNKTCK